MKFVILFILISFLLFFFYEDNNKNKITSSSHEKKPAKAIAEIDSKADIENNKLFNNPELRSGMERVIEHTERTISSVKNSEENDQDKQQRDLDNFTLNLKIELSNFSLSLKDYSLKEKIHLKETIQQEIKKSMKAYYEMEIENNNKNQTTIQELLQTQKSQLEILDASIQQPPESQMKEEPEEIHGDL